jgi:hypothetical protein
VKKLAIVVLLVVAVGAEGCRRKVVVSSPPATVNVNATGGATPSEVLRSFLGAAKAQDIQAFARFWGSAQGPARDLRFMTDSALEQRAIYLMKCLKHDSYRVLGESLVAGSERSLTTELKYRDLTRQTNFIATKGPSERWYVRAFEPTDLQDICVASQYP